MFGYKGTRGLLLYAYRVSVGRPQGSVHPPAPGSRDSLYHLCGPNLVLRQLTGRQ